jgi:hypothetical protein
MTSLNSFKKKDVRVVPVLTTKVYRRSELLSKPRHLMNVRSKLQTPTTGALGSAVKSSRYPFKRKISVHTERV